VKGGNNRTKTYRCSPSSCGHLHDIHYPFRLKTDPPQCGSTWFELLCNANEPYLRWQSGKFYVMSISYSDRKINVIDPALMNGTCNPPTNTLGLDSAFERPFVICSKRQDFLGDDHAPMASFVSCSRRIDKSSYHSCRTEDNSLLYVMDGYKTLSNLEPSCRRLSSTYISKFIGGMKSSEVFDTLGKGFELCWSQRSLWQSLGFCIQEAIR
jgi:Wall-associated receptor kinase galacturonan-binding